MNPLDAAMDRLDRAVAMLTTVAAEVETSRSPDATEMVADDDVAGLIAERDALLKEVEALSRQTREDKHLRAEAATAVREALSGLRGAVQQRTSTDE